MMPDSVRIDKWLWAVRLYKTRTIATQACSAGKVRINDKPIKPSRDVRTGEILTAVSGGLTKTVRVIGILENRVAAKLVNQFYEDLTPQSEYERAKDPNYTPFIFRPKGSGRPTKKERRSIEGLFE